jgi:hypothetical protein
MSEIAIVRLACETGRSKEKEIKQNKTKQKLDFCCSGRTQEISHVPGTRITARNDPLGIVYGLPCRRPTRKILTDYYSSPSDITHLADQPM